MAAVDFGEGGAALLLASSGLIVPPGAVVRHENPGHWQRLYAARPVGIIVHGSRSGRVTNSRQAEYDSTRRWAENGLVIPADGSPPYRVGWQATLGPGQWSRHFDAHRWGHNAGTDGTTRLAVECAQAVVTWGIPDSYDDPFFDWYYTDVVPVHGEYDLDAPGVLVMHSELRQGISVGKSDVFDRTDVARRDALFNRWRARWHVLRFA